ncbi:MAG: HD domain-containing protein [bacterium]
MRIKIIATVGDSLFSNLRSKELENQLISLHESLPKNSQPLVEKILDIKRKSTFSEDEMENLFNAHYSPFWQSLSDHSVSTFPSAELQSIVLLLDELAKSEEKIEVSEIIFIPTKETKEIANFLKKQLQNNISYLTQRYKTDKLSIEKGNIKTTSVIDIEVDDTEKFQRGLMKLYNSLEQNIPQPSPYDAIYIDITGGYKGFIPITALQGFLDDMTKVFYTHETSKSVLIIPTLPLSFSLRSIDEMRGVVRRKQIPKEEWENLPHRFKSLYYPSNSDYQHNVFGEMIYKFYEEHKTRRYGYGHYLLQLLNEGDRKKLEEKLPSWEFLWLGDQIPETVEHSRGHSMRLLEMAYQLFTLFPNLKEKLPPKQLFFLICAIWLHDIGHSALYYEQNKEKIPIYLMPSLVRDWHHLLSAQLIEKGNYLDESDDRKAVSLIAKYHRKMMKLRGNNFTFQKHHNILNEREFPSLENVSSNKELLLTCALLRLLDACDVQADRVVSEEYKDMRKKRTKYEMDFYYEQFKKLLNKFKGKTNFSSLSKLANKVWDFYSCCLSDNEFLEKQKTAEEKAIELFGENFKKDDNLVQLASLADRVIFKKRQEYDFLKHSEINLVYLGKKDEKLAIYISPNEGYNSDNIKKVAREIREEYNEIKDILEEAGIYLSGIYNSLNEERLDE